MDAVWNNNMKNMYSSAQNNISDLLKLAKKFNCFYLSGMWILFFEDIHIKIKNFKLL